MDSSLSPFPTFAPNNHDQQRATRTRNPNATQGHHWQPRQDKTACVPRRSSCLGPTTTSQLTSPLQNDGEVHLLRCGRDWRRRVPHHHRPRREARCHLTRDPLPLRHHQRPVEHNAQSRRLQLSRVAQGRARWRPGRHFNPEWRWDLGPGSSRGCSEIGGSDPFRPVRVRKRP